MTTVKQLCLGVAVAGVVAGAGSVAATAVAYAEPATSDSHSSADAGPKASSNAADAPSDQSSPSDADNDSERGTEQTVTPRNEEKDFRASDSDTDATEDSTSDATDATVDTEETATDDPTSEDDTPRRNFGRTLETPADDDTDDTTQPEVTREAEESVPDSVPETAASVVADDESPADESPADKRPADKPVVLAPVPSTPGRSPIPVPAPLVPAVPASATSVSLASSSTTRRYTTTADVSAQIADPTTQHVLIIGVDGTNLTRVLDDPGNANFFELMDTGTTGPATIVGHTTISNPSWTTILTGVWDTKSGVINNIFTPSTYDNWPTVFNQLEAFDPDIETKAVANWQIITDIAGAGSNPADVAVYIPNDPDDPTWSQSDAAVTAETVASILGTSAGYEDVPNFMFTYLAQVDEAGHQFGGASPEYAAAIARTNTNIGAMLEAVAAREAATGEDWTIIMVTDHGHQPQQGFGHGFQSPDETATFVIVDGPDFADGQMNLQYSIVDVTPTVLSLFGAPLSGDSDGVSLTTLGDSQIDPVDLHQAINDAFDMYGYPDTATNVALSLRTIFATIPYYVDGFVTGITTELQAVADQGIFLVSDLAALAVFPVQLVGDAVYAFTDVIAQIVARLTGAGVIPPGTSTVERDGQPYPWVLA